MDTKMLTLEFTGENHSLISDIAWILLLIKEIDDGIDSDFISKWLSKYGFTKRVLQEAIHIRNYDRKIIYDYGKRCNINPDWLIEYKEIVPEDFLHLLSLNR